MPCSTGKFIIHRLGAIPALLLLLSSVGACKFATAPKAPTRIGASDTIIIPETVVFERNADRSAMNLSFDTRTAAYCKMAFYPVTGAIKSLGTYTPCSGRSATKFSETISGLPKDQLVAIVILSWSADADEKSARGLTVTEAKPTADLAAINLLAVDLGGGRLELSSIASEALPSSSLSSTISKISAANCALSNEAPTSFTAARRGSGILSATSRGFINSSAAKVNDMLVGGSFQAAQRQSSEWSITARTSNGYGQLRVAKPTLLKSVIFAGREQASGDDDYLEDVDPPSLRLSTSQTFVSTWALDGDPGNAVVTLSFSPSGSFRGITCQAPAAVGKITVPASLIAQIPSNERLWVALRVDSWQAIDDARWLVRVSDWKSLGVQRF